MHRAARCFVLRSVVITTTLASTGCAVAGFAWRRGHRRRPSGWCRRRAQGGTEYSLAGSACRTFARPLDEVASEVCTALGHLAIPVQRDWEGEDDRRQLAATARDRRIEITLTPLTPATTALELVVKRGLFGRDRATASEIIAQTERAHALAEAALPRCLD